jgi:hypothetical protein
MLLLQSITKRMRVSCGAFSFFWENAGEGRRRKGRRYGRQRAVIGR